MERLELLQRIAEKWGLHAEMEGDEIFLSDGEIRLKAPLSILSLPAVEMEEVVRFTADRLFLAKAEMLGGDE